jgi:hypothetical protein
MLEGCPDETPGPCCHYEKDMKSSRIVCVALLSAVTFSFTAFGQNLPANAETKTEKADPKADLGLKQKADIWVSSLKLNDPAKEARVTDVIAKHLEAVRDWHNSHPFSDVPPGTNSVTGKPLNDLDRQMIADSAMPRSVHSNLMAGLRKDLTEEQVEAVLDRYTSGKVAFTLKGYYAIVPDLTKEEETTILKYLKQAREEAVDYKNIKQISAVFEVYKTKCEQYLISNGRNWKALYKAYSDEVKAKKAAADAAIVAARATNQPPAKPASAAPPTKGQ